MFAGVVSTLSSVNPEVLSLVFVRVSSSVLVTTNDLKYVTALVMVDRDVRVTAKFLT